MSSVDEYPFVLDHPTQRGCGRINIWVHVQRVSAYHEQDNIRRAQGEEPHQL